MRERAVLALLLCAEPPARASSPLGPPHYIANLGWAHDVPHDGNSLFSAVSLALKFMDVEHPPRPKPEELEEMAIGLRERALHVLCPNGELDAERSFSGKSVAEVIEPFLRPGEDGDAYCTRMAANHERAHEPEVYALAQTLQTTIAVHHFDGQTLFYHVEGASPPMAVTPPKIFLHRSDKHYRTVVLERWGAPS